MMLTLVLFSCVPAKVELGEDSREYEPDARDTASETGDTAAHGDTADTSETGAADTGGTETGEPPISIVVDLVVPSTGSTRGGELVTIYGGPFAEHAIVTFDGASATVSSWTASTLSLVSPAGEEGPADIVITTAAGTGSAPAIYSYVEPCEGVVATPSYVHTGNDDEQDVVVTLTGCATSISGVDELYTGYEGTPYGVTWTSVPSEVDGTTTATLHLHHWSSFTPSASYFPYLDTDQGRVTIEVDAR